jgi:hypothetical protein
MAAPVPEIINTPRTLLPWHQMKEKEPLSSGKVKFKYSIMMLVIGFWLENLLFDQVDHVH